MVDYKTQDVWVSLILERTHPWGHPRRGAMISGRLIKVGPKSVTVMDGSGFVIRVRRTSVRSDLKALGV